MLNQIYRAMIVAIIKFLISRLSKFGGVLIVVDLVDDNLTVSQYNRVSSSVILSSVFSLLTKKNLKRDEERIRKHKQECDDRDCDIRKLEA